MSDIGRRLRQTLDEVAPPADLDRIVAHEPSLPFWRVGRAFAYAAVLVAVVGLTGFLLTRVGSDDTAVDSSVTTVDGTVTTLGEGTTSSVPTTQGVELDTSHLTGEWYRTEPDTEGLIVITNDMIWDGEAFYVLTRLGFGDHVVWRSMDGIEWERYSTIAAAGDLGSGVGIGPLEILSVDGRLIGAGTAAGRATVWIDDGASGWSAIDLGPGGVDSLVYHGGRRVALGYSAIVRTDETFDDRIPIIWVSDDGESWEQLATEEFFGPGSVVSELVIGPAGLLAIVSDDPVDPTSAVSSVVMSADGESWSKIDPTGLPSRVTSVVGGDSGYAVMSAHRVFTSTDGVTWVEVNDVFPPEIEALQDSQVHPQGLGLVGDHLVMVGGIGFVPEGSEFNTAHPRVWSYAGHGWIKVGDFDWFDRPGFAYSVVGGNGVMVVQAETQVDGPEEWALFTFVADPESVASPVRECDVDDGFTGPMAGLPDAVDETRGDLVLLAADCDLGGLATFAEAGFRPFEYPLEHRFATPRALWSALEDRGIRPLGVLAEMLSGPFTTTDTGNGTEYWWPAPTDSSNVPYEPWFRIAEDGEWLSYMIPDRLLPEEWLTPVDWALETGDVLVANESGVLVGRGESVWSVVTGPVDVALSDLTGGIVFTTPDSTSIWRIRGPGAPVEEVFSAGGIAAEGAGPPKLYQVFDRTGQVPGPSVVFTIGVVEPITGWTVDEVWAVPLDGADALLQGPLGIETPGEGGVTGLGWLDAEGVFVMSEQSDGGSTLSLWDAAGEVAWPSNPESYETFCSGDPGFNGCLDAVAVIPGTSRIAYVVHDLPGSLIHNDERVTELVIYDLATESEVERVTILDGPGYSTDEWFVHASQTRVALTWSWAEQKEDGQWHYPTASAVYDLGSGSVFGLPFDGVASIVP